MRVHLSEVIENPPPSRLKELIRETKFLLTCCVNYKLYFIKRISVIDFENDDMMKVRNMNDLDIYNDALKKIFKVYTNYLKQLAASEMPSTETFVFSRYIQEKEWTTYCRPTAVNVYKGEIIAGVAFAEMASDDLNRIKHLLYGGLEVILFSIF
jgi:hypothetical protein